MDNNTISTPAIVQPAVTIQNLVDQARSSFIQLKRDAKALGKTLLKLKELCIQENKLFSGALATIEMTYDQASYYMKKASEDEPELAAQVGNKGQSLSLSCARTTNLPGSSTIPPPPQSRAERLNIKPRQSFQFKTREPGDDSYEEKPPNCDDNGRRYKAQRPTPQRDTVLDNNGKIVPDESRDAFADKTLTQMIEELELVASSVHGESWVKKAGKLTAHYPFLLIVKFDENICQLLNGIEGALVVLRSAVPFALCTKCSGVMPTGSNGHCCATCRGSGHLPQWRYQELTNENPI